MLGAEVELVDVGSINCHGYGIKLLPTSTSQLVATRCEISNNGQSGLHIFNLNTNRSQNVNLKNCICHHNSFNGIYVYGTGVINIHGDATAIQSNGRHGIFASSSAKVLIHLPSNHNTIYNNEGEDRQTLTYDGATITNVED